MVKLLAELAPAKINLFLRVVARRPDGYHELDSVFLPVSIYDQIRLELRSARSGSVGLRCDREGLPRGDRNLAWRAAAAFMTAYGIAAEVSIDLHKEIPLGAGLGGGSSDAGAVLRMMAAIYRVDAGERLRRVALGLGADVPFFLDPRPARIGGIGERITPLTMVKLHLLIAVPPFEVSTAAIFRELRPEQWSGAADDEVLHQITAGRFSPATVVNDLAEVALRRHPEIGQLKAILQDLGARASAMTGSGGAVFGVFADAQRAADAAEQARRRAPDSRFITACSLQ